MPSPHLKNTLVDPSRIDQDPSTSAFDLLSDEYQAFRHAVPQSLKSWTLEVSLGRSGKPSKMSAKGLIKRACEACRIVSKLCSLPWALSPGFWRGHHDDVSRRSPPLDLRSIESLSEGQCEDSEVFLKPAALLRVLRPSRTRLDGPPAPQGSGQRDSSTRMRVRARKLIIVTNDAHCVSLSVWAQQKNLSKNTACCFRT